MIKYFLIIVAVTISQTIAAQPTQADLLRAESLKKKYPWGSIYITYLSLRNLSFVTDDKIKLSQLTAPSQKSAAQLIQAFLRRNKSLQASEAIAFIELDLNRIEAGYKLAHDGGGEIHQIPWDTKQVLAVAELCDWQMNSLATVKQTLTDLTAFKIELPSLIEKVQKIKEDPLVSEEAYFVAANELRLRLATKDSLWTSAEKLMASRFTTQFDSTYKIDSKRAILNLDPSSPLYKFYDNVGSMQAAIDEWSRSQFFNEYINEKKEKRM